MSDVLSHRIVSLDDFQAWAQDKRTYAVLVLEAAEKLGAAEQLAKTPVKETWSITSFRWRAAAGASRATCNGKPSPRARRRTRSSARGRAAGEHAGG